MAAPWEKYGNPAANYGPDPVKVRQQQMQEEDQQMQREANARAAAAAARAAQAAERANANTTVANDLAAKKFQAELMAKGLMLDENGKVVKAPTALDSDTQKRLPRLSALVEQINRTQKLYESNIAPEKYGPLSSFADWLGPNFSDDNAQFDTAGAQISEKGLAAFRIPGVGTQSDRDAAMFERANMPTSATRDIAIEEQLRGMRARVEEEYAALGLEAPKWEFGQKQQQDSPAGMSPAGISPTGNPPSGGAPKPMGWDTTARLDVGRGSDVQKKLGVEKRYSTEEDIAFQKEAEALFDSGASLEQLNAFAMARHGAPFPYPDLLKDRIALRDGVGKYADRRKFPYNPNGMAIGTPQSGRRSDFQIGLNKALLSPAGTAAATATNAVGFGGLEALAPEAFDQMRAENPKSAFSGDVGGMIGGTGIVSAAGRRVTQKVAPKLLGGGNKAQFARNLAADATYGGVYGGVTEGTPEGALKGAALAGAGSAGGQLLGKGISKAAQGVSDPAVQYLTQRGIPLTVGQTLGNRGIIGKTMNKLESLPVVGDMMAQRRVEGLKAFENAALNDIVEPVGGKVAGYGDTGLQQAQDMVGNAYGDALNGVTIPGDQQFVTDFGAALAKGKAIPTLGDQFEYAMTNEIAPLLQKGQLSGPEFQAAKQALAKMRADFAKQGAMGNYAVDAVVDAGNAFDNLVGRQAPGVLPKYNAANEAYSNLVPFENARISAINQEAMTPLQLARAITSNTRKFGGRGAAARGANLSDLVKSGQQVLPSTVPNSGTADRGLASLMLPAALGGSSYAAAETTDNPLLAGTLGALAALSTKTGQKVAQKALAGKRPKAVKRLGGIFGSRKAQQGLTGMVTAPLLIED